MKFLMLIVAMFALIFSTFAGPCPAGMNEIQGICAVKRPIHGECPAKTRYDLSKNLCVQSS